MAPSAVSVSGPNVDHPSAKWSTKANNKSDSIRLGDVETTKLVLSTFRCLIADLCEQFKGGHPGQVTATKSVSGACIC